MCDVITCIVPLLMLFLSLFRDSFLSLLFGFRVVADTGCVVSSTAGTNAVHVDGYWLTRATCAMFPASDAYACAVYVVAR